MIQGGGYIAVEFAGIFAGLGSEVTLVYRGENILRGFDDDVRAHLRGEMERRGIKSSPAHSRRRSRSAGAHYVGARFRDGSASTSDKVMFAIGRRPMSSGSAWRPRASRFAKNGGIAVDDYSRTSVPHIYAVGDVTNRVNLTPVAIREGHAFADTRVWRQADGGRSHQYSDRGVLRAGARRRRAHRNAGPRAPCPQVDIYKAIFRPMKATLSGRDTRMLMKLVVDGTTDRVVGCHIVGEGAAEMIQMVGIAVKMGATKADFDATMALHPTAAEELVTMRTRSASYVREAAE